MQLVLSDSASDAVSLLIELLYKGQIKFDTKLQFDKVVVLAEMMQIQIPTPVFKNEPESEATQPKIEDKPYEKQETKSDQEPETERKPNTETDSKGESKPKINRYVC